MGDDSGHGSDSDGGMRDTTPDHRDEWICAQVVAALRVKESAWLKLFAQEAAHKTVMAFLEGGGGHTALVFSSGSRDDLHVHSVAGDGSTASASSGTGNNNGGSNSNSSGSSGNNGSDAVSPAGSFPATGKRKAVVLTKRRGPGSRVARDDPSRDVVVTDLGPSPLEQLHAVMGEVYVPLLRNARNREAWPEVVAQDVMRHVNKFVSELYVIVGRTKGETRLPLPPPQEEEAMEQIALPEGSAADKDTIHVLESHVIDWTHQIKNVVRGDPESVLNSGLNPGPLVELDFWASKTRSLQSVYDQLRDDKVKAVIEILERSQSSYFNAFDRMFTELVSGLDEAKSNSRHLEPLRPYFEKLSSAEITEVADLFVPMLYLLSLVWSNSPHYNSTARMMVLFREICNALIESGMAFLDSSRVLKNLEEQDTVDRLEETMQIVSQFKAAYFERKREIDVSRPSHSWNMSIEVIFERLDPFLQRCQDVAELSRTCLVFSKLETVQIGGSKGAILSAEVARVFVDFENAVAAFKSIQYDLLDLANSDAFAGDYTEFMLAITDLDRRIGAILTQAFDDCVDVHAVVRLLLVFDGVVHRENVREIVSKRYHALLAMFDNELDLVHAIYREGQSGPPIYDNMPPVSGLLLWTAGLRKRVAPLMERVDALCRDHVDPEDFERVSEKYTELIKELDGLDDSRYDAWRAQLDAEAQGKLLLPLLARHDDSRHIGVNFDPTLASLLKESRYFVLLDRDIPESAQKIEAQAPELEAHIDSLDAIRRVYNRTLDTLLDVERPLVQDRIDAIDAQLDKGLVTLNWTSAGLHEYTHEVLALLRNLDARVTRVKRNEAEIRETTSRWWQSPLLERGRDSKKAFNPEEDQLRIRGHYDDIQQAGLRMHKLLSNTRTQFEVSEERMELWEAYVEHINQVVADGFVDTIKTALTYVLGTTEPTRSERLPAAGGTADADGGRDGDANNNGGGATAANNNGGGSSPDGAAGGGGGRARASSSAMVGGAGGVIVDLDNPTEAEAGRGKTSYAHSHDHPPLMEARLELNPPDLCFIPSMEHAAVEGDEEDPFGSVQAIIADWIRAFYETCSLVRRLDDPEVDYLDEVSQNIELNRLRHRLLARVRDTVSDCIAFRNRTYGPLGFLWLEDREAYLDAFLAYGPDPDRVAAMDVDRIKRRIRGEDGASGGYDGSAGAMSAAAAAGNDPQQLQLQQQQQQQQQLQLQQGGAIDRNGGDAESIGSDDEDNSPAERPRRDPTLEEFAAEVARFRALRTDVVSRLPSHMVFGGWLRVELKPVRHKLSALADKWAHMFLHHLSQSVQRDLAELRAFTTRVTEGLTTPVAEGDIPGLIRAMTYIHEVQTREKSVDAMFAPLRHRVQLLQRYDRAPNEATLKQLEAAPQEWITCKKLAAQSRDVLQPMQVGQVAIVRRQEAAFAEDVEVFRQRFEREAPFDFARGSDAAYRLINAWHLRVTHLEREASELERREELFELTVQQYRDVELCRSELTMLKTLWDMIAMIGSQFSEWTKTPWGQVNTEEMEVECRNFLKNVRSMPKQMRKWDAYQGLESYIKNFSASLPLVQELRSPAMRDRHWRELMTLTGVHFSITDDFSLADLLALQLHEYSDDVATIVDKAGKEEQMERALNEFENTWSTMRFTFAPHASGETSVMGSTTEIVDVLEDNQVSLQAMQASKHVGHFLDDVNHWLDTFALVDQVMTAWLDVQRTWMHLEGIFIGSADIRAQLPEDTKRFDIVDADFKDLVRDAMEDLNVVNLVSKRSVAETLERLGEQLALCQKSLDEYLETKRRAFPRFFFVSPVDMLDILSNGGNPPRVMRHMGKLFDSISKLELVRDPSDADDEEAVPTLAMGMYSREGEYVPFGEPCGCTGPVEHWLSKVEAEMRATLRRVLERANNEYAETLREEWIGKQCAQVALTTSQIWWTSEVNFAFEQLEAGNENALKEYNKKQQVQLDKLIEMIQGDLEPNERQKVMSLVTLDVHALDVVADLIRDRVESAAAFSWVKQLRTHWEDPDADDDDYNGNNNNGGGGGALADGGASSAALASHAAASDGPDCYIRIADAEFRYWYEYLGNSGRLVITPLTDRCYITLTQALRLIMGGSPAGPAGTGKTETTKDLGRALGLAVYVFNCSEQMDYRTLGNVFKGLCISGAWGCFDEFNRIPIEVLSVVSTQFKSILDAIRARREHFLFEGQEIPLRPTCGVFVTMNPGYAGRTELPENLKALFRPVAMIVPDIGLICEIMLMAQGFHGARVLAKKFTTLYELNKELLSKQDHYDWGLRAVKSVLVVAGALRRADPGLAEEKILMRALRDFNLPKITAEDAPLFMGLINDLFPKIDLDRKRDVAFEGAIKDVFKAKGFQPEELFIRKVVELRELMDVRHSVFIIGPPASGKSECWRCLAETHVRLGEKCQVQDLNPKAVSSNELYGYIVEATREWKDGLFSIIMRNMSEAAEGERASGTEGHRWIVLDGDIDPEWIESLNTVMDDNKVLTLASNERIPLTDGMRLVFEIANLKCATPATVSRAGILYLNETDLGWNPYVQSWIDHRANSTERSNLVVLFDKYTASTLEYVRRNFEQIVPVSDFSMVQTVCRLLDGLLTPEVVPPGSDKEVYELFFVFAAVWGFGGALAGSASARGGSPRHEFDKWWRSEWKAVKFPDQLTVFDFYIDPRTRKLVPWSGAVRAYEHDPAKPISSVFVPTPETTALQSLTDLLIRARCPVMLVGEAGTGKTLLMRNKLAALGEDGALTQLTINLNFYSDSLWLQGVMEQSLEKKHGHRYGPPGTRQLVYFVDDLNMPEVDLYYTQQPITLLRQLLDYAHFYDRHKMTIKEVENVQFLAAMNPTAGSFTVNPRLQRHFSTFAVSFPGQASVSSMLQQMLSSHFEGEGSAYRADVGKAVPRAVAAMQQVHARVSARFIPTATKFHYQFNLRDLASVVEGMVQIDPEPESIRGSAGLAKLWLHETQRVYRDRLVDAEDESVLDDMLRDITKSAFEDALGETELETFTSLVYAPFGDGYGREKAYKPISDRAFLRATLEQALSEYNEVNATMDLVLFEQAMAHVARIARIIELPRGNPLLIGVGGSGKQSLARLAAFIAGYEVFQISISKSYNLESLRLDLQLLYTRVGVKNMQVLFLFTDSQIADPRFLVYINDLLASGDIPNLFPPEERDNIISSLRPEVKAMGLVDTREVVWEHFIDKVRRNLHVCLCFSPVGGGLRARARRFPALVNKTMVDWFHAWPHDALLSVAERFVTPDDIEADDATARHVVEFMAMCHAGAGAASEDFRVTDRRRNYTTPKSFLELITLYKSMLARRRSSLAAQVDRLRVGLDKLRSTAGQVADLQSELEEQQVVVEERKEAADALLQVVGKEKAVVDAEAEVAAEEERKMEVIAAEVTAQQEECARDLAEAEPMIVAAEAALDLLDKKSLTELKSFPKPPTEVAQVMSACLYLIAPEGRPARDVSWAAAKKLMSSIDRFLTLLRTFDKDHIPAANLVEVRKYLVKPGFNSEDMMSKSSAAAGICGWVINIVKYYDIYLTVQPKRERLAEANEKLQQSQAKLQAIKAKVESLTAKLGKLQRQFAKATDDKNEVIEAAEKTALRIELANRLINGLAGENVRWAEEIDRLLERGKTLVGNVLLAAAFVSYIGPFNMAYRERLLEREWLPEMERRGIPMDQGVDVVLDVLSSDAEVAEWNNEGLPTDRISVENGAIALSCERWPLILDPQLQGVRWIKEREKQKAEAEARAEREALIAAGGSAEAEDVQYDEYGSPIATTTGSGNGNGKSAAAAESKLRVIRLNQAKYLDKLERAVAAGETVLIENVGEEIDAVLDPLLGRNYIRRGHVKLVKLGDKEIEVDPNFRLILQTKLANPHYKPEIQAQTTMVNFTVTLSGLEEQLLAIVVNRERPDLEREKEELMRQQNEFKIRLKELENSLLERLSNAEGDILGDVELIENLETTKRTAIEIAEKARLAKETQRSIDEARERYRRVASRGSLIYFLLNDLGQVNNMYQYSLGAFMSAFELALKLPDLPPDSRAASAVPTSNNNANAGASAAQAAQATVAGAAANLNASGAGGAGGDGAGAGAVGAGATSANANVNGVIDDDDDGGSPRETVEERVARLEASVTYEVYRYASQGLFVRHKLIFVTLLCMRIQLARGDIDAEEVGALLSPADGKNQAPVKSPVEWISDDTWRQIESVGKLDPFRSLPTDVVGSAKRWKEWAAGESPEADKMPQEWKNLSSFRKLLVIRALRPDRLTHATRRFVAEGLGARFIEPIPFKMADVYAQMTPATPAFFILSPGVDPVKDVEALGRKLDVTIDNGKLRSIALGQGQEIIAEQALDAAYRTGGWVFLQNIHLTRAWLPSLEKKLEELSRGAHEEMRVFLSAEPSSDPTVQAIPIGILQASVKVTNEPPAGMAASLSTAMASFGEEVFESSAKPNEFRVIVFALCYFHATVLERRKFGPQGFNIPYNFNAGDLTISVDVIANYLEAGGTKIPWEDLRYVLGDIIYGGHVSDDWDRRYVGTALEGLLSEALFDDAELAPQFPAPPTGLTFAQLREYAETNLPEETPALMHMHANAETESLTAQGREVYASVLELQPRSAVGGGAESLEEAVGAKVDSILDSLPEPFDLVELLGQAGENRTPYISVCLQECERLNNLVEVMRSSLSTLRLAIDGVLSLDDRLERLMDELALDKVPAVFSAVSAPSMRALGPWLADLAARALQLQKWAAGFHLPKSIAISLLFNPQSFLRATMQAAARKNGWPLDKMAIQVEAVKKSVQELDTAPREGAYIHGLYLEGARWDASTGQLAEQLAGDLHPAMPVVWVKGIPKEKVETKDVYACPCYGTRRRGPTFIFTANLRSKSVSPATWVLRGACLLLEV